MTMDVGAIMNQRIRLSTSNNHLSYLFPQFITTLCTKAGVNYAKSEVLLQPGELLTQLYMNELTSSTKGTKG